MTQEISMAPPTPPTRFKIFQLRGKRAVWIILFIALVILAGIFSWWLSRGKVSSVAATLDSVVYTVEPQYEARLATVQVNPGDIVAAGQRLGNVDLPKPAKPLQPSAEPGPETPAQDIIQRLNEVSQNEKLMSQRVAQARFDEDRERKAWQELVTAHVRAQLAMRSINIANRGLYEQASAAEQNARARMESAREKFEEVSKMRAAMDVELNRIRAELQRAKAIASRFKSQKEKPGRNTLPAAPREMPVEQVDTSLYSPVAGRVLKVNAMTGQMVQAGQPVFVIQPTGKEKEYWIQAWFPVKDLNRLQTGQKVAVRFANGLHLNGRIAAISSDAQALPANITGVGNASSEQYHGEKYLPVRVSLDNPAEAADIEPGSRAQCQIQTRYILSENIF